MTPKTKKISLAIAAILVVTLSLTVVISENFAFNSYNHNVRRVACLGDSITNETGYPDDLQVLLGNGSIVGNFGVNGAAVNLWSDSAYRYTDQYNWSSRYGATTVILMFGANDARNSLSGNLGEFVRDYERLISRVQNFSSKPQVYLVLPPPIFNNTLNLNVTIFNQDIIPYIRQVANETGVPLIDANTPLLCHPEYFSDGVHPNGYGAQIIAQTIYNTIK
jgi:lysophospholipase L1-like esterase